MRVAIPLSGDQMFPDLGAHYSPEMIAASGAYSQATYKHSKLPLRIFEAARIATAVINGCIVCRNWRAERDVSFMGVNGGVIDNGDVPDEAFYQAVLANDLSALTDKERVAVIFAQRMGNDPQGLASDEEFWAEVKAHLTDAEIVDLAYCTACWIGLGRVAHVLGSDTACNIPTHKMAA
ncbi:MAG TPA: carboxymuconolactone decarboxylase family protein [Chakrabartia sp.]|jgi:alkylhydroperoxidase family enzyme|nr:carboxymuconolactone decarboxylase family protein [Chakrabartia sp.]